MAHFAEVDNNYMVLRVVTVSDAQEHRGHEFLSMDLGLGGRWYKTSYNTSGGVHQLGGTPYRKNYAGVGYFFDRNKQAFIPPKPFPSWILDEETCLWKAPTSMPINGNLYNWNEETTSWEIIND